MDTHIKAYSDIFIKYLLGSENYKHLLLSFINAVFMDSDFHKIISVEIQNPFNIKEHPIDRESILDIKATDENGRYYDIEVQSTSSSGYKWRSLYYWAKLYSSQLAESDPYTKLRPTICINVLNFKLFPEIKAFHNCFLFREHRKPELILTDHAMLHYLELPKLSGYQQKTKLFRWLKFLSNEGKDENLMKTLINEDKDIAQAHEAYEKFTNDKVLRDIYEAREKWKKDLSTEIEYARQDGEAKGFTKGEVKGKAEGKADDILKILEIKFGTVSNPLAEKIKSLNNIDILDELIELAVTIDDIEKLSSYLK